MRDGRGLRRETTPACGTGAIARDTQLLPPLYRQVERVPLALLQRNLLADVNAALAGPRPAIALSGEYRYEIEPDPLPCGRLLGP